MEKYYTPSVKELMPGFKYEVRMWVASESGIEYRWEEFEVGNKGSVITFGSMDDFDKWSKDNIRVKIK